MNEIYRVSERQGGGRLGGGGGRGEGAEMERNNSLHPGTLFVIANLICTCSENIDNNFFLNSVM